MIKSDIFILFRITDLKEDNKRLTEKLKETMFTTLTAEENAKEMEKMFFEAKQEEIFLTQKIKKRSDTQFKVSQKLYELKTKEKNLKAEIDGCEATIKNLENRISRLDHESLKQAEVIYGQVNKDDIEEF